ncbi:MAG TPA: LLM class flavin-dependent oxidoreductase [Candidatus Binataceae bacterium]|nr:LLM class flavin-dependent oxidoreductase [Candidatus Binataceae bacterium]
MSKLGISIASTPGNINLAPELAREAEAAGFVGTFTPEGGTNDGLMTCFTIARATSRIGIYTWITNIHFRLPVLCAGSAMMVQEAAAGRFVLGLGVSHRPAMEALGVRVENNRDKLRAYAGDLRRIFNGEVPGGRGRPAAKPSYPMPIYFSALSLETARLAGEMADGMELLMCSPERARRQAEVAWEGARANQRDPQAFKVTVGTPVYLSDDLDRAYQAAQENLAPYLMLPFYQRQWVRSGFEAEAKAAQEAARRGDSAGQRAAVSRRLIDSVALVGSAARCAQRLADYQATGAEIVVLSPRPVQNDMATATRAVIKAFGSN